MKHGADVIAGLLTKNATEEYMLHIYNYIINCDLIFGIPHASKARCRASHYTKCLRDKLTIYLSKMCIRKKYFTKPYILLEFFSELC